MRKAISKMFCKHNCARSKAEKMYNMHFFNICVIIITTLTTVPRLSNKQKAHHVQTIQEFGYTVTVFESV